MLKPSINIQVILLNCPKASTLKISAVLYKALYKAVS